MTVDWQGLWVPVWQFLVESFSNPAILWLLGAWAADWALGTWRAVLYQEFSWGKFLESLGRAPWYIGWYLGSCLLAEFGPRFGLPAAPVDVAMIALLASKELNSAIVAAKAIADRYDAGWFFELLVKALRLDQFTAKLDSYSQKARQLKS